MRTVCATLLLFFLTISAAASEPTKLTVKVLDPQAATVGGARISLYRQGKNTPITVSSTDASGNFEFRDLEPGDYRIQVLAPGFAPENQEISFRESTALTLHLKLAPADQTVTVTAAATPATGMETSSEVSSLDYSTLQTLQPATLGDALRFIPGAILAENGQRGGLTSLFVRGGDSDYNKVIIDGVPVNEPGGFFDFGGISTVQMDRVELLRGSESTLYGSDAMTSVMQVWSRTGSTRIPLLTLGADGGNLASAHGYGSFSGAIGRFDYNLFGDQFNTAGKGVNDSFSNSTEGLNVGYAFTPGIQWRVRMRHNTNRVGDQGEWNFSQGVALPPGDANIPPDSNAFSRQNNFLGSTELTIASGGRWIHHFSGYEYSHRRLDEQDVPLNPQRVYPGPYAFPIDYVDYDANFNPIPSKTWADYNRAGFNYQGEYWARNWARTIFGYEFEDENGFFGDLNSGFPVDHGLRRNHAAYGEELITWKRFSFQGGARFVHNENFGNRGVPRAALSYLLLRGGSILSGTRLRGSYSEGIKEPSFEDTFGEKAFGIIGNPNLKPEQNRAFEAGLNQSFYGGKYSLDATYFNNQFHDQIQFQSVNFIGSFINLNRSMAHGAEVTVRARPVANLQLMAAYVYTSTQILLSQSTSPTDATGAPFLRRPKQAGSLLATYTRRKFGATLGGSFIGRRPDSDFSVQPVPLTHDAGYVRFDVGGWYAVNRHVTTYVNAANILNKHYEDTLGYPALGANFRAGMRFSFGGE